MRKASVSEIVHNLGWQSRQSKAESTFNPFLQMLRWLKRRTSSRQPTPAQEESQLQIQTPQDKL